MNARALLDRPDFELPEGENVNNTLFMIDLLAAWIRSKQSPLLASATTIAGTILCPIFRSEKGPKYARSADLFRARYAELSQNVTLAADYLGRIRPSVTELRKPDDVFQRPFAHFFNDQFEEPQFRF